MSYMGPRSRGIGDRILSGSASIVPKAAPCLYEGCHISGQFVRREAIRVLLEDAPEPGMVAEEKLNA